MRHLKSFYEFTPPATFTTENLKGISEIIATISTTNGFGISDTPMGRQALSPLECIKILAENNLWNSQVAEHCMVHLKTRTRTKRQCLDLLKELSDKYGVDKFLIISGDGFDAGNELSALQFLQSIPKDMKLSFSIAFDFYSKDLKSEILKTTQKLQNGASAVFLQPVWSLSEALKLDKILFNNFGKDLPVYWALLSLDAAKSWEKYWKLEQQRIPQGIEILEHSSGELVEWIHDSGLRTWSPAQFASNSRKS